MNDKGYPTPDYDGDIGTTCIPVFVPDHPQFIALIMGMLYPTTKAYFWSQVGTMTPEEASLLMEEAYVKIDTDNRGCVIDCNDVYQCINDNPNAIALSIANSGAVIGNPSTSVTINSYLQATGLNEEVAPPPANCDKDVLWAGIRELVHRLDDNSRNMLEIIVSVNDKYQRIVSLIEIVPVVGSMVSSLLSQIVETAPDILNLYNSWSTEAVMDEIACDLFEMVCNKCRYPTYDEILSYYGAIGVTNGQDIKNIAMDALWDYVFGSALLGARATYFAMISIQLYTLSLQSKFNQGFGKSAIALWIGLGEDLPSDDWEILCNACVSCDEYLVDFAVSEWGFANYDISNYAGNQYIGEYSNGAWRDTLTSWAGQAWARGVGIERTLPNAVTMEEFSAIFGWQRGQDAPAGTIYGYRLQLFNSANAVIYDNYPAPIDDPEGDNLLYGVVKQQINDVKKIRMIIISGGLNTGGDPGGSAYIQSFKICANSDPGIGVLV